MNIPRSHHPMNLTEEQTIALLSCGLLYLEHKCKLYQLRSSGVPPNRKHGFLINATSSKWDVQLTHLTKVRETTHPRTQFTIFVVENE